MKKLFLLSLLFLSSFTALKAKDSKPPRQKIEISGLTLSGKLEKISVDTLEKEVPSIKTVIFDPYNKNLKTTFTGVYFSDFVKKYAKPETTKVFVKAIDGYSVETPVELMKSEKIIMVYKDEEGYLSVKRMGPVRIIYPMKEPLTKEQLLKIGLHWVWQVKSLEFKK